MDLNNSMILYRSVQWMSGSNRVRNGHSKMISPVDFVVWREKRIVSFPIFRYNRA